MNPVDKIETEKDIFEQMVGDALKTFNENTGCQVSDILFMKYPNAKNGKQTYRPYKTIVALPFQEDEEE